MICMGLRLARLFVSTRALTHSYHRPREKKALPPLVVLVKKNPLTKEIYEGQNYVAMYANLKHWEIK